MLMFENGLECIRPTRDIVTRKIIQFLIEKYCSFGLNDVHILYDMTKFYIYHLLLVILRQFHP